VVEAYPVLEIANHVFDLTGVLQLIPHQAHSRVEKSCMWGSDGGARDVDWVDAVMQIPLEPDKVAGRSPSL